MGKCQAAAGRRSVEIVDHGDRLADSLVSVWSAGPTASQGGFRRQRERAREKGGSMCQLIASVDSGEEDAWASGAIGLAR